MASEEPYFRIDTQKFTNLTSEFPTDHIGAAVFFLLELSIKQPSVAVLASSEDFYEAFHGMDYQAAEKILRAFEKLELCAIELIDGYMIVRSRHFKAPRERS
jgi:hypothetical protein